VSGELKQMWLNFIDPIAEQCGFGNYLLLGEDSSSAANFLCSQGVIATALDSSDLLNDDTYDYVIATIQLTKLSVPLDEYIRRLASISRDALILIAIGPEDSHSLRANIELTAFKVGLSKHRRYYTLLDYEKLEYEGNIILVPLQKLAVTTQNERYSLATLARERDLHMDMLRESGRRSDAHVVRYQLASSWISPGSTVIDAACGMGYGVEILAANSPGSFFTGIDGSETAIDYAKNLFLPEENSEIEFKVGLLPKALAEYKSNSVNALISFETLEHLEDPQGFLAEAFRILSPGGRIIVSVPNDWADESGKDPNPYHLHVYTWEKLERQLSEFFIVENRWRQIASGCKSVSTDNQWRPGPRLLEQVPLGLTPHPEAEWWIAVAMKSPEVGANVPYVESIHPSPKSAGALLDFESSYANPWLVHALVEFPYRLQDKRALEELATRVYANAAPGSADAGAALAVQGYRLLESDLDGVRAATCIKQIDGYLEHAMNTTHALRWRVSLSYLAARLLASTGDTRGALSYFLKCINFDGISITPTLGTKSVDAALWIGRIKWASGEFTGARDAWGKGIAEAERALRANWQEFHGDKNSPLVFSMNDAVEILDKATQCAHLLSATGPDGHHPELALWRAPQSSLRTAFLKVQNLAHTRFAELQIQNRINLDLNATLQKLKKIASENSDQLINANRQIAEKDVALDEAQKLAWSRFDEIQQLSTQLLVTQQALSEVQEIAFARFKKIEQITEHISTVEHALVIAQTLADDRHLEITKLSHKLDSTETALASAQTLALNRHTEIVQLSDRLDSTSAALSSAQELALNRYAEIGQLSTELHATKTALSEAQTLALVRFDEIMLLRQQLTDGEVSLSKALDFATLHLNEVAAVSEDLAKTRVALDEAQKIASLRLNENIAVNDELARLSGALEDSRQLVQQNEIAIAHLLEQVAEQNTALQAALQRTEHWQSQHAEVLASRTWRWTQPLRKVADSLKSLTTKFKI